MSWRNIRLIYGREIRDQLRDRRTLFMIAVLPLLLYPLLGMSVFQLSQFLRKSEPKVLVVGSEQLAESAELPPLFEEERFAADLFDNPADAERLRLEFVNSKGNALIGGDGKLVPAEERKDGGDAPKGKAAAENDPVLRAAEKRLKSGDVQLVLRFPPDFGERMHALRSQIRARASGESKKDSDSEIPETIEIPRPQLIFNAGKERSQVAHLQVAQALENWTTQIARDNLQASRVPVNVAKPFELQSHDVAERRQQQALLWSKILPFVLFIWALTGAFYPAVDLCAGEKERGTLETLLSSPALRIEIVWGKLLTVMTFSAATALLNLVSLGFTARYIVSQLRLLPTAEVVDGLDLPPLTAGLWLVLALVPMSALFSALCLACAAFARSTKEGQYYLMPLLLVMMPLMMLPMAPGSELNLGNALIPVTGVVLLLMGLVQGNYAEVLRYVIPVCVVTAICCHWAIRWAVFQFNQESVLFRESERFDVRRWVAHLVRDREETPSLPQAFFCVALIFVIQFLTQLAISSNMPASPDFRFLAQLLFISQVVCIALPAMLMALLLTGKPLKTLLLDRAPSVTACVVAVLLAVLLHPVGLQIVHWIRELYPIQHESQLNELFGRMFATAPYWWLPYVLLAVLPAICEELAFRGFILSGLRHLGSKWWAIGLSAVFFGMAHTVVQQSLAASVVGVALGYIAVQTGSLVPCMLFHLTYNGLMFAATLQLPELAEKYPGLAHLFRQPQPGMIIYTWPVLAFCAAAAVVPLVWLYQLPHQLTKEEQISEARARQPHHPLPASVPEIAE